MTPSKLKVGDIVFNGTLMRGVVGNVSEKYITIYWNSTRYEDVLSMRSPIWVILTCVSSSK